MHPVVARDLKGRESWLVRSRPAHDDCQNARMEGSAWSRLIEGLRVAAVPVLAIAFAVASITLPQHDRSLITSLTQLSPLLTVADVVAGLAMIAAGSIAWLFDRRTVGLAAVLAGVSWFGPDWAGSVDAPGLIRAAGLLATALTLPLLACVVVLGVGGVPAASRLWIPLAGGGAIAILVTLWLAAWVPALDPRCLAVCATNPLGLGIDHGLARALANAWQGLTAILGAAFATWAVLRLRRTSGRARRRDRVFLGPAIGVGAAWAFWGVTLLAPSTLVPPAGPVAVLAFVGRAAALTILAAGLATRIIEEQRTLASIRRIAERLSPLPGGGTLRAALAGAFGDPEMRLVYVLPDGDTVVDDAGRPLALVPTELSPDQVTPIRIGPETVALAIHAPRGEGAVVPELGPAVRLAADNERLLASIRHEMLELRASRTRIVEAGDVARHRLERDLHDGAQQRMLGVLHQLSMARSAAEEAGEQDSATRIDRAALAAGETIDGLRRLARGLHQSVLTEAGLSAALEALADESPIPVAIDAPGDARYPASTEAAAWRLASRLIAAADRAGACDILVRTREEDGHLVVTIVIGGMPGVLDTESLADHVGAAGGELASSWSDEGSMTVRAELPCG
jgi:signal transduction histidine kinase